MKTFLSLAFLLVSVVAFSQTSLKDALYSGKLRLDTGTVIRKGEDLSSKIDTSTKKPADVAKKLPVAPDSAVTEEVLVLDSAGGLVVETKTIPAATTTAEGATAEGAATGETGNATKDNNKAWKDYMDELIPTLRTEVMPNKKIKSGTYSVLVEYEIDVDGQVDVKTVSASPSSSFLEEQVRNRMILTAPKLTPLLNNYGKPRKAIKKYTFTLAK